MKLNLAELFKTVDPFGVLSEDVKSVKCDVNFYLDGEVIFLDALCIERSVEMSMKRGDLSKVPPPDVFVTFNFSTEEK